MYYKDFAAYLQCLHSPPGGCTECQCELYIPVLSVKTCFSYLMFYFDKFFLLVSTSCFMCHLVLSLNPPARPRSYRPISSLPASPRSTCLYSSQGPVVFQFCCSLGPSADPLFNLPLVQSLVFLISVFQFRLTFAVFAPSVLRRAPELQCFVFVVVWINIKYFSSCLLACVLHLLSSDLNIFPF